MKIQGFKYKLITFGAAIGIIAIMYHFDLPCPFQFLFHIDCPGCGITRAYISLFRLDLRAAFSYHPLFWTVPLCLILYLFDGKLFRKQWINNLLIGLLAFGFLGLWLLRLLF